MVLAFSSALMTLEDVASANRSREGAARAGWRLALTVMLIYVLWALANQVYWFGGLLNRQHREQQEFVRTLQERSEREARLVRENSEARARQQLDPRLHTGEQRTMTRRRAGPKLTTSALVGRLRQVNAFGLVANPERRLRCSENRGDWDYTCWFHPDPIKPTTWVQFGVLVDDARVIEVSGRYPPAVSLPKPLN
jgi:hypothetical protein